MRVLILGGTRFLGRHLVDAALARGHTVTLFNRGKTNPGLYAQDERVESIIGNRETDLDRLNERSWDAVIDTCGYFPRVVRLSAQALKSAVRSYVFISSISVYEDTSKIGINEDDPTGTLEDESIEDIGGGRYGPLKALCEQAVQREYAGRALIIRPGLIVGPHDPTDRFTYWPVRVARGGDVLAPEKPQVPVQIIDVRDLAGFCMRLIEAQAGGVFNTTGPGRDLRMGELLETCRRVSGSNAVFKWASVEFLAENKVEPWSDLPVWLPDTPESAGFSRVDISRAMAAGLVFRPLEETVRATLDWASTRPTEHTWRAGLDMGREAALLEKLRQA